MEEVEANEKLLAWAEGKDLSVILKRVQQYINLAEGPNHAPPDSPEWHGTNAEQLRARTNADLLMEAYAISEAMREAAKPATERIKPVSDVFEGGTGDLERAMDRLAEMVGRFCRVKIRWYATRDRERRIYLHKVYGYEADVRYFQFLYTTLRLHFIGALHPKIDSSKSMEENCYVLHMAGYGWREIAKMYGWTTVEVRNGKDPETWFNPDGVRWEGEARFAVRPFRLAYWRQCKKLGEEPVRHIQSESYRLDAIQGYLDTIRVRLEEVEAKRKLEGGSALAIRIDDLEQFIREESGNCTKCPKCGMWSLFDYRCDVCGNEEGFPGTKPADYVPCPRCMAAKSGTCNEHRIRMGRSRYRSYSEAGYQAGVRQGRSADLGGQRTGSSTTKSIN